MSDFKKQFSDLTSEYLLQLRARGDDLSDEAHQAIEEIFSERGEHLPAKPKSPIFVANNGASGSGSESLFKSAALIGLGLIGMAMAKALAQAWVGVLNYSWRGYLFHR